MTTQTRQRVRDADTFTPCSTLNIVSKGNNFDHIIGRLITNTDLTDEQIARKIFPMDTSTSKTSKRFELFVQKIAKIRAIACV